MFSCKRIARMLMAVVMTVMLMFVLFLNDEPVHADEKTIRSVYVECHPGIWYIMPDKNGNENYSRLAGCTSLSGEGIENFIYGNITVRGSDGVYWGVNSDSIDPEKQYFLSLKISAEDGFAWPDEVLAADSPVRVTDALGLRVFFNGSRCNDASVKMYLSDPYFNIPISNDISAAKVTLSETKFVGNGKRQVPSVTKAVLDGRTLTSKNYIVSYHDLSNQEVSPVEPGKYTVWLKGKGIYSGIVQVPFTIGQPNPMKVSVKKVSIKYGKLKKKAQIIKPGKAIKVSNAEGTVTYKLVSAKKGKKEIKLSKAKKYFKITAGTGKIKVKKNLEKGTYILKVKVSASGNASYEAASKTVTVKIKIQ